MKKAPNHSDDPIDQFRAAAERLGEIFPAIRASEIPVLRSRDTSDVLLTLEDIQVIGDGDFYFSIERSHDPRRAAIFKLKSIKAAFLLDDLVGVKKLTSSIANDSSGETLLSLGDVIAAADMLIAQVRCESIGDQPRDSVAA